MAFSEVNPATNKVYSREELFKDLVLLREEKIARDKENSKIISWQSQWVNIQERWNIHLAEWDKAVNDCYQAGVTTRKFYNRTFA